MKAAMEMLVPKFRKSLAPVYASLPIAALRFSAAIFTANTEKLIKLGSEKVGSKLPWEAVQNAILSGVLVRYSFVDFFHLT